MSSLQAMLFGRVRISNDGWRAEIKLTRGIQPLFAYLLINRDRMHSREVLAGTFWGDFSQAKARLSLNTALWRLRSILEPPGVPPGTYLVGAYSGEVGLNPESPLLLDTAIFEQQVQRVLSFPFQLVESAQVQELEQAMQEYKGELMEGFYDDWILRERERLRSLYLKALRYLLQYDKFHGLYERGIQHSQQILDLDPLQEEIQRDLMRLYIDSGQRAQAVRQYTLCRKALAEELGIPAMPETQALYEQIVAARENGRPPPPAMTEIGDLQQALQQLSQATQAMAHARAQIHQAVQYIEKFTGSLSFQFPIK